MVLGIASYLVDGGNGVGIVGDAPSGRIADLWIEPSLLERLELEVKTPQKLRGPLSSGLDLDEARKIIAGEVNRAASTKSGQLNPAHSGILAIGAYHLGEGGIDVLEHAAADVLAQQGEHKKHLAAVVVCEQTCHLEVAPQGRGPIPVMHPILQTRIVRHPGYGGDLKVEEGAQPFAEFGGGAAVAEPRPKATASSSSGGTTARAFKRRARKSVRAARRRNRHS
jgi:hypothetical protein